jgi:hypothetical protein
MSVCDDDLAAHEIVDRAAEFVSSRLRERLCEFALGLGRRLEVVADDVVFVAPFPLPSYRRPHWNFDGCWGEFIVFHRYFAYSYHRVTGIESGADDDNRYHD